MAYFIGIDIGGTKTSVALVDTEGEVVVRNVLQTASVQTTLSGVKDIIRRYIIDYDKKHRPVSGIGICSAGVLDLKQGVLISSPNMPGWRNIELKSIFMQMFSLPVVVDNDANAAAVAEKTFGAGKDVKNLFYYTVSTGIGAGLIIDGKIYHGASSNAGEIGHSVVLPGGPKCNCGQQGCLEALSSGTAIARIAAEKATKGSLIVKLAGGKKITAVTVAGAAKKGDKLAIEIFQEAAFYLGLSMASVIQIFNPEMIIVGGGVSKSGNIFFGPLRKNVRKFSWPVPYRACKIVRAKLKDAGGDLGAASLVFRKKQSIN